MEHAISFPALGLNLDINRVAVNLFGKDIYWYGIIICLGFVLAALYMEHAISTRILTSTVSPSICSAVWQSAWALCWRRCMSIEFGVTSDLMDCLIICGGLRIFIMASTRTEF